MKRNTYKGGFEMNKRNILLIVIIIIILFVILYIVSKAIENNNIQNIKSPIIISDTLDASVQRSPISVQKPTEGLGLSINTWIFVSDWNYNFGKFKPIIVKGSINNSEINATPALLLYPETNALQVITKTTFGNEDCSIQNIPLQTWVNICYILDNRNVDIYINGKLERSCALKGIPTINENDSIYVTPSFDNNIPPGYWGKIGKTQYFSYTITPDKVSDLYASGPIGSPQYKIQFFQNGKILDIKNMY